MNCKDVSGISLVCEERKLVNTFPKIPNCHFKRDDRIMHTRSDLQLRQWSSTFVETLAKISISWHADKGKVCLHLPLQRGDSAPDLHFSAVHEQTL